MDTEEAAAEEEDMVADQAEEDMVVDPAEEDMVVVALEAMAEAPGEDMVEEKEVAAEEDMVVEVAAAIEQSR